MLSNVHYQYGVALALFQLSEVTYMIVTLTWVNLSSAQVAFFTLDLLAFVKIYVVMTKNFQRDYYVLGFLQVALLVTCRNKKKGRL